MKAAVYNGKDKIEIESIADPELEDGGAVIKVSGCGLCGSDIVKLRQNFAKKGAVLGHEVVGYIHEIREECSYKVGDRVVLGHHVPCFNCVFCRGGNYSMCKEFKSSNIKPGGFCEYIYVSKGHLENTVFKVPDSLSDEHASFTEPVACCLRAVKRAKVKHDDVVLVVGLGSIGLLMGQLLKNFGAKVIGCDLLEDRVKLAQDLGFDKAVKYTDDEELAGIIKDNYQEEGADKVFLVSGHAGSIPLALKTIRNGGTVLVFASVPSDEAGFPNNEIYYRELTVLSSYSASPEDLSESLELIKNGIIKVDGLYTEYGLDSINRAVEDTCQHKIIKAYVKVN